MKLKVKYKLIILLTLFIIKLDCLRGQTLPRHTIELDYKISAVQFINQNTIAYCQLNGEVGFWNPQNRKIAPSFNYLHTSPKTFKCSSSGTHLIMSNSTQLFVRDIIRQKNLYSDKQGLEISALSHNGTFIVTSPATGKLQIKGLGHSTVNNLFKVSTHAIVSIDISANNRKILIADEKGKVFNYDLDKNKVIASNYHNKQILNAKFEPDGLHYILQTNKELSIESFDDDDYGPKSFTSQSRINACVLDPRGYYIAAASEDGKIYLLDQSSLEQKYVEADFNDVRSLSFREDGRLLAVGDLSNRITLLKLPGPTQNSRKKAIPPKIEITSPSPTEDGFYLAKGATVTFKGTIKSNKPIFILMINGKEVPLDEHNNFSSTIELNEYENDIYLKAIDADKSSAETLVRVLKPHSKPDSVNANKGRTGKDYALLIGTDEYDYWGDLKNPIYDITTIKQELEEHYGFETDIVTNATTSKISTALRNYSKRKFGDQDQLFIFIAGHGLFDNVFQQGYLVGKESVLRDASHRAYISHSDLRTIINSINCKHIFLVMDVCFGGAFERTNHRGRSDGPDELSKEEYILLKMKHKTRQYLTSGGEDYVSDGRPGQHSPFSRKFIEALRSYGGTDAILTISEIMQYVERVKPEPWLGEFGENEPGSEFLFIQK